MDSPSSSRDLGQGRRSAFLRKSTVAIAGSALAFGGSIAMFAPTAGNASSHREAPLIANDPSADNTDTYAFVSPDKPDTVTLVANWIPFQEPGGGPNFYPWSPDAHYDINLDTDGDALPNITYRWQFRTQDTRGTNTFLYANGPVTSLSDPNLLFRQTYTLTEIRGTSSKVLIRNGAVAPSHVGNATMPNYGFLRAQATKSLAGGLRTYAGQADDPFFLDLRVFDLLYGGDLSEAGADTLNGFNVNTVALQVPKKALGFTGGESVVGVWSTTERPSMRVQGGGTEKYSGDYVQVSRLGHPLVNEVVVPAALKDAFNAIPPSVDRTIPAVVAKVTDPELPKLIEGIYGIKAPKTPRTDLVSIYLTGLKGLNQPKTVTPAEMLRLNTAIKPAAKPNRLGVLGGDVAGFPNGRRLADDVIDISIQAVEGAVTVNPDGSPKAVNIVKPLAAGDAVNVNDKAFGKTFPYVALPHSGSRVRPGSAAAAPAPAAAPVPMTPQGPMNTGVRLVNDMSPAIPAGAAGLGALFAMAGVVLFRRERRQTVAAR
ncbi:MAG TPA: DUF4331 domain-containing protein [Actinomycetales bacterium]